MSESSSKYDIKASDLSTIITKIKSRRKWTYLLQLVSDLTLRKRNSKSSAFKMQKLIYVFMLFNLNWKKGIEDENALVEIYDKYIDNGTILLLSEGVSICDLWKGKIWKDNLKYE